MTAFTINRTGKGIPKEYVITCNVAKKGRPESDTKKDAFLKTCIHLEMNEKEQYQINKLVQIMTSYMEVADADPTSSSHLPYKNQYMIMKQKLAEKYGDSMFF